MINMKVHSSEIHCFAVWWCVPTWWNMLPLSSESAMMEAAGSSGTLVLQLQFVMSQKRWSFLIFILHMYNLCISSFSAQRDGSMKQDTNPAYTCTSIQEMLSLFLSCCSYATASHVTSAYSPCNVTSPFPQIFSDFVGLDGSVSTEKRQSPIGKSAYEGGILQGFQKLPTTTIIT